MSATSYDIISYEGIRMDGRRAKELRRVNMELGAAHKADGSATVEQGNTKVMVSVFGPREVKKRSDALHDRAAILCEYTTSNFCTSERKTSGNHADRRSRETSLLIKNTFESMVLLHLYPRSQISIFVHVLQDDGGALACSINAVTAALINAGISMKGFVAACSSGFVDGESVLDLNYSENRNVASSVTLAVDPNTNKIALLRLADKLPAAHFEEVVALGIAGCKELHTIMTQKIQAYSESVSPLQFTSSDIFNSIKNGTQSASTPITLSSSSNKDFPSLSR